MDDLLLEVVVFLGTCAVDSVASQKICKVGILDALIDLLKAKQEDDEIVLQVVYVFHQLCLHEESRAFIIKGEDVFWKFRTMYCVCKYYTVRRKCEYGVLFITNATEILNHESKMRGKAQKKNL